MDFSKFKTHDWLIAGGGIAVIIFGLFLDWQDFAGVVSAGNAFDFTFTGLVPWLIAVAIAVLVVLTTAEVVNMSLPVPLVALLGSALATLLFLIRVIFNPGAPSGVSIGMGAILTLVGSAVMTAGAVMAFMAGGGDLKDLTDMNKMKAAFSGSSDGSGGSSDGSGEGGGDDAPPPPPPPSA